MSFFLWFTESRLLLKPHTRYECWTKRDFFPSTQRFQGRHKNYSSLTYMLQISALCSFPCSFTESVNYADKTKRQRINYGTAKSQGTKLEACSQARHTNRVTYVPPKRKKPFTGINTDIIKIAMAFHKRTRQDSKDKASCTPKTNKVPSFGRKIRTLHETTRQSTPNSRTHKESIIKEWRRGVWLTEVGRRSPKISGRRRARRSRGGTPGLVRRRRRVHSGGRKGRRTAAASIRVRGSKAFGLGSGYSSSKGGGIFRNKPRNMSLQLRYFFPT